MKEPGAPNPGSLVRRTPQRGGCRAGEVGDTRRVAVQPRRLQIGPVAECPCNLVKLPSCQPPSGAWLRVHHCDPGVVRTERTHDILAMLHERGDDARVEASTSPPTHLFPGRWQAV